MINNPVLRKELFMRLRLRQTSQVRTGIFLAILFSLGTFYYFVIRFALQYTLIILITPAVTANAITLEKEQQTWDMLLYTNLTPGEIIFGKLIARVALLCLLLVLFLPISLFAWMHSVMLGPSQDSISVGQFALAYLVMFLSMLFFSTAGMFLSFYLKRTLYSIMGAYTFVVGGLIIGTTLITVILATLFTNEHVWINPVMLMVQTLNPNSVPNGSLYLIFGLLSYVVLSMLMLWRMIYGFRRFAAEA
jgi:ABC-type transport system involved in multi-copper enzyme maturation permease subunit